LNLVHEALIKKIREATVLNGGLLAEKFLSMEDEQIVRLMFTNYRGKENSRGMRLTKFGLQVMQEFFKGTSIVVPNEKKMATLHMLYLEKSAKFPYYFYNSELVVFDDMLGFKLKLADGDIDTLIKIERTEVQN
jgi:hypothetical protein